MALVLPNSITYSLVPTTITILSVTSILVLLTQQDISGKAGSSVFSENNSFSGKERCAFLKTYDYSADLETCTYLSMSLYIYRSITKMT